MTTTDTTDAPEHTRPKTPPPTPIGEDAAQRLPQALVFFVSVRDRARVLAALRRIDRNRDAALLKALGVHGRE